MSFSPGFLPSLPPGPAAGLSPRAAPRGADVPGCSTARASLSTFPLFFAPGWQLLDLLSMPEVGSAVSSPCFLRNHGISGLLFASSQLWSRVRFWDAPSFQEQHQNLQPLPCWASPLLSGAGLPQEGLADPFCILMD